MQWPVVQQQQHKWQRNKHRLGHEAEKEKCQREKVSGKTKCVMRDTGCRMLAAGFSPMHIRRVGQKSQKEEKAAQHIFPLSDPCDRFYPQRVQPEEKGCC